MEQETPQIQFNFQLMENIQTVKMKFIIFSILSLSVDFAYSANILYLSNVPSPSHFIWCRSLLRSLEKKGHNVTALSPDVEKSTPTMNFYHLEKIYSRIYNESSGFETDLFKLGEQSALEILKSYAAIFEAGCIASMDSHGYKAIMNFPNDFKFDMIIVDNTGGPCLLPFLAKFGYPPLLSVTPFNGLSRIAYHTGSPLFSAFSPTHSLPYITTMTFSQRFISFYSGLFEYYFVYKTVNEMDNVVRKRLADKFPDLPYLGDLEKRASIFLVNSNQLFDHKEPAYDNIKLVGGAQINEPKPLPSELQTVVDNAKDGFILFSLGSNVRSENLGTERIISIINTMKLFPKYKFLWKFEAAEKLPVSLPENVFIQSWMPQNDILAHPNIKLFITHSGMLSIQEAMWYGVPIIGLPVFGDQLQNIIRMSEHGVGKYVNIRKLKSEELYEAIKEVLENPKYQQKAKAISRGFRDQPQTPLELATFWAEWVMRHPDTNLQNTAALKLNFLGRHSYDVLLVTIFGLLVISYALIKIEIKLISLIKSLFKSKPKDKKIKAH